MFLLAFDAVNGTISAIFSSFSTLTTLSHNSDTNEYILPLAFSANILDKLFAPLINQLLQKNKYGTLTFSVLNISYDTNITPDVVGIPNKFTNHIVSSNDELYNYLDDVNYGMNKPQFHHITTIINGLINLDGTKSLFKISEHILTAKSSSSIFKIYISINS